MTPPEARNSTLMIGLSSWIISAGYYKHFTRDSDVSFALEFYARSGLELAVDAEATPSMTYIEGTTYSIVGQVIHNSRDHFTRDWWAIDCGLGIYRDEMPPEYARIGEWVRGDVYLGVDPLTYFDHLAGSFSPPLIYDWHIEKIEIETTPWIELRDKLGRRGFVRDDTRRSWKEVASTAAPKDDKHGAEYRLHCRLINGTPRRYK